MNIMVFRVFRKALLCGNGVETPHRMRFSFGKLNR